MTSWETHLLSLHPAVQRELAQRTGVYSIYKWLTGLLRGRCLIQEDWNETALDRLFTANRLYGAGFDMMTHATMRMRIPMALTQWEFQKCKNWEDPMFQIVERDLNDTRKRTEDHKKEVLRRRGEKKAREQQES